MRMRILVTGATGFVGRVLCLRLLRDGHQLIAWVRNPDAARQVLGAQVETARITGDDDALVGLIERVDAIVNLAGEPIIGPRWTDARKQRLVDSRVGLTERLVRAIGRAKTKPSVLVSASAVGIYGDTGDRLVDEASPPATDFLADLCVRWEAAARGAEAHGLRVALLRIGIVLGPEGGALEKLLPLFSLGLGGKLGSGRQSVAWIHLRDLVELAVTALGDARYTGPINAVGPEPADNARMTRALARAVHRPAPFPAPAFALKLALGEASVALLASQRVAAAALQRLGFRFAFKTIEDAVDDVAGTTRTVQVGPADDVPRTPYLERRRARHVLVAKTTIDAPIDEVFEFFSRAENLGAITPPALSFAIRTPLPIAMRAGAEIDYTIKLGPLPMQWRTIIQAWEPGRLFVDAQERGPYRAWWHEHHFEARGAQTYMEDRVYYAPPFGVLGDLANALFVRPMLRRIFGFRGEAIAFRFGARAA